jgi:hypothetical protein
VLPNPAQLGSALSDLIAGGGKRRDKPDFRQAFYLALARVLGAAAWIDGPINQPEVNMIKGLLNELSPRLTSREVQSVQRYLTEPVPDAHWDDLLFALSDFTRRRGRLQFVLLRLQTLLAADGELTDEEKTLFAQVRSALDWRGSQPDLSDSESEIETPRLQPGAGADAGATGPAGIRLGDLAGGAASDTPRPLVDRVREAAAVRLGVVAEDAVPRRLVVWSIAVAHVTVRRARTDGEDAELVGFVAAVAGVEDAAAEVVLEQAREVGPAGAESVPELASALRGVASAVEVASLAQLLNAMAGGDAALRRLQDLSRGMKGLAW